MLQHVYERAAQARYLTKLVIATDDKHPRSVLPPHPVLEFGGECLGNAEFGQDDNACSRPAGDGDETVDLIALSAGVGRADWKRSAVSVAGPRELVDATVGVTGGDQRVGGDEPRKRLVQAVVKHHPELDRPIAREP